MCPSAGRVDEGNMTEGNEGRGAMGGSAAFARLPPGFEEVDRSGGALRRFFHSDAQTYWRALPATRTTIGMTDEERPRFLSRAEEDGEVCDTSLLIRRMTPREVDVAGG